MPAAKPDWNALCQLVQQLAAGNLRRYTFNRWELDLLLDLQAVRMRRSSRPEMLRRYLRTIQRQIATGAVEPMRFSHFYASELQSRQPAVPPAVVLPRAS